MDQVEAAAKKALKSYIGQGDVQTEFIDEELHVYVMPVRPVNHITVNFSLSRGSSVDRALNS